MRIATALGAISLLTVLAANAHAQTCTGSASFSANPIRLGAGLQTGDHAKAYGINLGFGSAAGPYASGTVSRAEYDGISGAGTILDATLGYAVDVTPEKNIQLCPFVSAAYQSGPDIDTGFGTATTSGHAFGFGGSLGGIIPAAPNFDFVPFAGASYVLSRSSATISGVSDTESQNYTEIEVGAGFVINKIITVRPSVLIPVGVDGAKSTFQLGLAFNFGGSTTRH